MVEKLLLTFGLASTVVGCVAPADDEYASDGKEDGSWPELKAGPISYKRFVSTVLRVSNFDSGKTYLYLGDNAGTPCKLGLWYSGAQSTYSDMFFDVHDKVMEDDGVAGVQIQYNATITVKKLADGQFDFHALDNSCHGEDDATVTYADNFANPRTISAISTVVRERGCMSSGPFTVHQRSCDNLVLTYMPTTTNTSKAATLLKAKVGATAASRLTPSRYLGCELDLAHVGDIDCSWDVSDDPSGDTGDIQHGRYQLSAGAPVKVLATYTVDKYGG